MPEEDKKGSNLKYARLSGIGIQMGVIIALFTWLGTYLDKKFQTTTQWWTIGLSLFGVAAALILIIKEVINMSKDDEK